MIKPALFIGVAAALGLLVAVAVLQQRGPTDLAVEHKAATVEYGQRLIRNTAMELGSGRADPAQRFSGNNLACASCHMESGQKPGTLSLMQSASKYPAFSARDGRDSDLADRINGCMVRSMNGKALDRNSVEMQSMVSYIVQLGRQHDAMSQSRRTTVAEPPGFAEPDRMASVENGGKVYLKHCRICHGGNGEGLKSTAQVSDGYLFPPLWGPDSYNIGAGMARVLTAARFIKARMPLGNPLLSDDEAFDVAAFMNAQERPGMAGLEKDYPDLARKPVDSPYPPYADSFSVEQHRFGPFAPIRAFYRKQAATTP
jgi:thiosulfate dehydrogenase